MKNFKIGILSDTHKRGDLQQNAIAKLKDEGAEYLLHLGDFELPKHLEDFANSGLPYATVFGNNDYALNGLKRKYRIKKEPYYLKIKDTTIKMMHLPYYMSADTDIVLYGHTHKFSCELKGKTLFLNPGEVCAREKNLSECAMLEVKDYEFIVTYYFREPNASGWKSKIYKGTSNNPMHSQHHKLVSRQGTHLKDFAKANSKMSNAVLAQACDAHRVSFANAILHKIVTST